VRSGIVIKEKDFIRLPVSTNPSNLLFERL